MRSVESTDSDRTVDAFLDVEFLHSLGCYTGAKESAEKIRKFSIEHAGGALRRTQQLNELLEAKRDDSRETEFRHPDPRDVLGKPEERKESFPLSGDTRSLQLMTDFYSTGIAALNVIAEPSKKAPEGALLALEKLGECVFWDRDPSSSAFRVNESFRVRQEKVEKIRKGSRTPESTAPERRVQRRMEAKRQRFIERRDAVASGLKPRKTHFGEWEDKHAAESAARLLEVNLSNAPEDFLSPGFVLRCLVAAHLRLHGVEHFLSLPFPEEAEMSADARKGALSRLREAEALNTFVYAVCRCAPWIFARDDGEMEKVIAQCQVGFGAGAKKEPKDHPEAHPDVFAALWRSQRIALLAMHRRAFGHSLRDALVEEAFNDTAFKDFHKLQRLLRVQRRVLIKAEEVNSCPSPISPSVFVAGIDALAETHIGDLYRSDHAHPIALQHFCDANDRLDDLSRKLLRAEWMEQTQQGDDAPLLADVDLHVLKEGPEYVAELLQDSRWRIHLMMSKGKGFYEAGNLKRSVKWLLKSWSGLLLLIYRQSGELREGRLRGETLVKGSPMDENGKRELFGHLTTAIQTLREVKNDPDFSKEELEREVTPIIESIERTYIPPELRVIAAEILLRLGHVLFVIRLGPVEGEKAKDHELARRCLARAGVLDGFSILVTADLLKIEHERGDYTAAVPGKDALPHGKTEWPFGRGNPDQIIRMIEYHLLWWLAVSDRKNTPPELPEGQASDHDPLAEDDQADAENPLLAHGQSLTEGEVDRQNREVARRLIAGLLTHTDSINVRQSQVYRYLMQPQRPSRQIGPAESWAEGSRVGSVEAGAEPAIEFICLRRYSSFFPFVPRPSAFRSLGGGYLLRLHHQDEGCRQPFGVAVDPGPDFIENLYRCGFGLGDIDMIVLTHDHPDHSVDLDPILSLLGYRMNQGDRTFAPPTRKRDGHGEVRRLLIVGNESVVARLRFFNKPHVSEPHASEPRRPDAVHVVSFDQFDAFREEMAQVRETFAKPEVAIPRELRLKPVVSIRHPDGFGMLAYGFKLSLGDAGPSIGFTGDTGGFRLEQVDGEAENGDGPATKEPRWRIRPFDEHETMRLTGDSSWRDHWKEVLEADVLVPHVSGLPLAQLLVLANDGGSTFPQKDDELIRILSEVWNGLDEEARKQVTFAFWLPQDKKGTTSLPLEDVKPDTKWPRGHLYLIGLLEFARAYQSERRIAGKPGLFLVGELREELGSLRGKIAFSLNKEIFDSDVFAESGNDSPGCRALTADIGLRLMISRSGDGADVRVLCSICDLDNDRARKERFHDPAEIREVCVKGENEGMFYNCANHDPLRYAHPVFIERIERYDVFSDTPIH